MNFGLLHVEELHNTKQSNGRHYSVNSVKTMTAEPCNSLGSNGPGRPLSNGNIHSTDPGTFLTNRKAKPWHKPFFFSPFQLKFNHQTHKLQAAQMTSNLPKYNSIRKEVFCCLTLFSPRYFQQNAAYNSGA